MPKVEIEKPLNVPVVPARTAASEIIHEMAGRTGKWTDFALYAMLKDLGLPDVGYVAIPAVMDDVGETFEPRHEISFRLSARRSPDAFPTFTGGVGIDSNGPSSSIMWLGGNYDPPLKGLGALLDQFFARGVAEKSLGYMLDELADEIQAKVERREIAEVRYRRLFASD
jgi:hypothetical protein